MFSRKETSYSRTHGRQSMLALALVLVLIGTGIGSLGNHAPASETPAVVTAESAPAVPGTETAPTSETTASPSDAIVEKPSQMGRFEQPKSGLSDWFQPMHNKFVLNFIKNDRWRYLTGGLVITTEVALSAVFFGAFIGFFIPLVRTTHEKRHNLRLLNSLCKI